MCHCLWVLPPAVFSYVFGIIWIKRLPALSAFKVPCAPFQKSSLSIVFSPELVPISLSLLLVVAVCCCAKVVRLAINASVSHRGGGLPHQRLKNTSCVISCIFLSVACVLACRCTKAKPNQQEQKHTPQKQQPGGDSPCQV